MGIFSWFTTNAAVEDAISKVYAALQSVEAAVNAEKATLVTVNDKISKETETHSTTVAAINDEFKRKLDNETTRFDGVKQGLDEKVSTHTTNINKGEEFSKNLRAALNVTQTVSTEVL